MKLLKPSALELYSFIFSMPLIAVIINLILYEDRLWKDYRIGFFSVPLICLFGIVSWYLHQLYDHWVEKKYPALNQSKQRALLKTLVMVFIMPPSVLVIFFVYTALRDEPLGGRPVTVHSSPRCPTSP